MIAPCERCGMKLASPMGPLAAVALHGIRTDCLSKAGYSEREVQLLRERFALAYEHIVEVDTMTTDLPIVLLKFPCLVVRVDA